MILSSGGYSIPDFPNKQLRENPKNRGGFEMELAYKNETKCL